VTETARDSILLKIRRQLPPQTEAVAAAYARVPRAYTQAGSMDHEAMIALLIDRLEDYDSDVVRIPAGGDVAGAVAYLLAKLNETKLILPAEIDPAWVPSTCVPIKDAPPLGTDAIEDAQAVLTPCEVAVASTGTIILKHGPAQGRRVLTLLPDHHICVVRENQVVESVPEAFAQLASDGGSSALTTISGPSATADIEMTRIRGVHGPRRLSVILIGL
jgi:L-lactate dehydrogenase complex protein LldG